MLYLHFCSKCNRIHILSGHRKQCPACDNRLTELSVSYKLYIEYSAEQRMRLLEACAKPYTLQQIRSPKHGSN